MGVAGAGLREPADLRAGSTEGSDRQPPARLSLLKGFDLRWDEEPVPLGVAAQRLLALLALKNRRLIRVYVAGVLWPNVSEERSCANLRSAVWRLRRPGLPLISCSGTQLALSPRVEVDVRCAVALWRRVLEGQDDLAPDDDYLGELLPDWYDDWVEVERQHLRQLRLHALEIYADRLLRAGKFGQAADVVFAVLRTDPLRDSAHRVLIAVHIAEGNAQEALSHYRAYARRVHDELGLEPSAQMKELVRASTG